MKSFSTGVIHHYHHLSFLPHTVCPREFLHSAAGPRPGVLLPFLIDAIWTCLLCEDASKSNRHRSNPCHRKLAGQPASSQTGVLHLCLVEITDRDLDRLRLHLRSPVCSQNQRLEKPSCGRSISRSSRLLSRRDSRSSRSGPHPTSLAISNKPLSREAANKLCSCPISYFLFSTAHREC